jgi:hypothetical protein
MKVDEGVPSDCIRNTDPHYCAATAGLCTSAHRSNGAHVALAVVVETSTCLTHSIACKQILVAILQL